jgi:hypothetical protein
MRPAGLGIRHFFWRGGELCRNTFMSEATSEGEDPNVFDAACVTQTMGETTSHYAFQSKAFHYLIMAHYSI